MCIIFYAICSKLWMRVVLEDVARGTHLQHLYLCSGGVCVSAHHSWDQKTHGTAQNDHYQVKQGQWEGKGEEAGGRCGHCNSQMCIGLGRRCQLYKTACLARE